MEKETFQTIKPQKRQTSIPLDKRLFKGNLTNTEEDLFEKKILIVDD